MDNKGPSQRFRTSTSYPCTVNGLTRRRQGPLSLQDKHQLQRRRLHNQSLPRNSSTPDATRLHNIEPGNYSECQQHAWLGQGFSPLPAPSRGSLVALLREQRLPDYGQDRGLFDAPETEKVRRDSDDEEIVSLLQSRGNGNSSSSSNSSSDTQQNRDCASKDVLLLSLLTSEPIRPRQQLVKEAKAAIATAKVTPTSVVAAAPHSRGAVKTSRYLREIDRHDIIHRMDRGEKQAALAKEFGVTRAAISHIKKNRVEILTRSTRADVHSGARHPKRGQYITMASMVTAEPLKNQPIVFDVRSAAMALLLTTLRQRETASRDFQICTDRAFRLLLEEALARVATRPIDVVTPSDYVCEGIVANKPSCGVSISEDGFALLQVFRSIQPASPAGFITLNATAVHEGVSSEPTLQKVCVPADVRVFDVFLMEATCATGAGACVSIQALLDFGVQESSIHFVCLLASAFGVSEICRRFPAVHIVTGAIDPEVSDDGLTVHPGVGSFSERYFDSTLVHFTKRGASADF